MKLKNNRGITLVDITISVGIIFLFSSLISGLVYNYAISGKAVKRRTEATNFAVVIIERLKQTNYTIWTDKLPTADTGENKEGIERKTEDGKTLYTMTLEDLNKIFEGYNLSKIDNKNGYTAKVTLEKYSERDGNESKSDLITIATVEIEYKVGTESKKIELTTLLVGGRS